MQKFMLPVTQNGKKPFQRQELILS